MLTARSIGILRGKARDERAARFQVVKSGSWRGLSPHLLHCAFDELQDALDDRLIPESYIEPDNHSSDHSLGSLLLLVAGFESWLNESMATLFFTDSKARTKLIRSSTWRKYLEIPKV